MCMVYVITKEHFYIQQLHQETYDIFDAKVNVYDGFSCPTICSIDLHLEFGTKFLDVTFSIILY